jgi:hypothetical protein
MLKGLIVCPVCGMRFYGRKRVDLSDNQYICCSQRLKNFCGNRGMNIDKMNNFEQTHSKWIKHKKLNKYDQLDSKSLQIIQLLQNYKKNEG